MKVYIITTIIIAAVVIIIPEIFGRGEDNAEKRTAYECGYEPYEDARNRFEVDYYIIGIIFMVFDIEALYIYPWIMNMEEIGWSGYMVGIDFIVELIMGYVYVWKYIGDVVK